MVNDIAGGRTLQDCNTEIAEELFVQLREAWLLDIALYPLEGEVIDYNHVSLLSLSLP